MVVLDKKKKKKKMCGMKKHKEMLYHCCRSQLLCQLHFIELHPGQKHTRMKFLEQ